ncbi:MAG: phosphate/phosphite/phosphonate ABC transporter substrate-binding protein [Spirochaetales bacterium]|nr:phosphate/phosphite/phosphonate ABC transporter substrate-binding protein [Spirochaetales bacterium]
MKISTKTIYYLEKANSILLVLMVLLLAAGFGFAAGQKEADTSEPDCTSRGLLDVGYCDEDGDLVADAPTNPANIKDPDVLFFTYTPLEDPAVYVDMFQPFLDHIAKVTGKEVRYYTTQSYAAEIEAMRSGRLHIAGISTGPTCFAVNLAGYIPFSIMGTTDGNYGYRLQVIVPMDSDIQTVADLKGKTVAHTEESSNSGNQAPRALLPEEGIIPGEDYKIVFSGGHDSSILGVYNGDYEAATIASSVLDRMVDRDVVSMDKIRIVSNSAYFPPTSFGYANNL